MCIAILVTKGNTVPVETLERCFNGNRDGAGFAWVKDGKVVIDKGFMQKDAFLNRYKQLIENKTHENSNMLIHCRIATMGKVCPDNCHPFKLRHGALIHNGSLWWDEEYWGRECEKSDTRQFAERLHNVLEYDDIVIDAKPLEKAIGGDKMVMLFDNDQYIILNEDRGVWKDGVWYSHSGPLANISAWTGRRTAE